MKNYFRNLKLRKKILLVYVVVYLSVTLTGSSLYYYYSAEDSIRSFRMSSEDILLQMRELIQMRMGMIDQRANAVLTNSDFLNPLSSYLSKPSEATHVVAMSAMPNFLKDMCLGENLIHSSFIHTKNYDYVDFTRAQDFSFRFQDSVFFQMYQDENTKAKQWFPAMEDAVFIGNDYIIPYTIRFQVSPLNEYAYMIIQISQKELKKLIQPSRRTVDNVFIIDSQGRDIANSTNIDVEELRVFLSMAERNAGTVYSQDIQYAGQHYMASVSRIEINGWQIVMLKSKASLTGRLRKLRWNIILVMLVLLILSSLILFVVARRMTDALSQLEVQMCRVRKGEFSSRFYYCYQDEVGSLSKSFNYMTDEIERLVEKQKQYIGALQFERDFVVQAQQQKRKAELRALQAQINPHFLYNTLNTITWQANNQGAEEIEILSNSLGKFFRLSLSKGAEIIPLRNELEHVANYLNIQSISYRDRIRYEILVPDAYKDYYVMKLILQPLVENSIYHGIQPKEHGGKIQIHAEVEDKLLELTVIDDGVGIPPIQLQNINHNLQQAITVCKDGYGIYNVNERIRLYYGEEFGLRYESIVGSGTRAILRIPIKDIIDTTDTENTVDTANKENILDSAGMENNDDAASGDNTVDTTSTENTIDLIGVEDFDDTTNTANTADAGNTGNTVEMEDM